MASRKAAISVPPRIKEDILNNDGRSLKLFLQNVREQLNDLVRNSTGTSSGSGGGTTIIRAGSSDADTLDGFDSSDFARKAANETITGTWTHTSSVTATQFIETSDKRLKKSIKPLKKAAEIIKSLVGVSYTRKDTKEKEIGFIAQDVQKVLPELVSQHGEYLGVNYSRVVAVLVEAFKEQEKRVSQLEAEIANLKRNK